nr:MAG: RNA dependent RNA polymerase [Picornaviridae sp.]
MANNTFTESYVNTKMILAHERVQEDLVHGTSFFTYLRDVSRLESIKRRCADTLVRKQFCPTNKNTRKIFCSSDVVNAFIVCSDRKICVQLSTQETLASVCYRYTIPVLGTWFTLNGKPLKMHIPLNSYGLGEGSTIVGSGRLLGGSSQYAIPLYTHVQECERQVLYSHWALQSEDSESTEGDFIFKCMETLHSTGKSMMSDDPWILSLFENFFQVVYWLRKCDTKQDYIVCTGLAFKLITGKGVSTSLWKAFMVSNLQDDAFTSGLRVARDLFTTSSTVISDPVARKIRQIYTFLLVQGVLSRFGLSLSPEEFKLLDVKTKIAAKSQTSMVMLIIETALSICERFDTYRTTGDWRALTHDDVSYVKWSKEADRIISLAPFTSNLSAHGTTYFSFISDLSDAIEKGEAICRYTKSNLGADSKYMQRKLQSLQLLKNVEVTRRASQKERKAPFGVLIHGGSSVAKSTFTKMLFYYYGQLHGLDTDDHYRYVRNPADEYWSNFDSSKWCIQMDDIAFLLASKCSDTDPTLKEMLNVVNNVPYVPPQAALEDKGKTPVMAKLVLATTNTPDLNAQDYFACPLAVRRRLPYVVKVVPKNEYLHANGKFIDPTKLTVNDGEYPNFWDITVQKLVHVDYHGRDSAKLEKVAEFTDVREFLKHFAEASLTHEQIQTKSDSCDSYMRTLKVCRLCYCVGEHCDCVQSKVVFGMAFSYVFSYVLDVLIRSVLQLSLTWFFVWCYRFRILKMTLARMTAFLSHEVELKFLGRMNAETNKHYKVSVKRLIQAGYIVLLIVATWKTTNAICNRRYPKKTEEEIPEEECDESDDVDQQFDEYQLQGNIMNTTEDQLKKETTQNVWYNSTLTLSQFDVPTASRSLANCTAAEVRDLFSANCVRLEIKALDAQYASRTGAVFLTGQFLCVNRHAFRLGSRFQIKIIDTTVSQGLTSNVVCYVSLKEMRVCEERDIIVMSLPNVPPRKNILKYWNTTMIPVSRMVSVARDISGSVTYSELFNVNYCEEFPVETLQQSMPVYMGIGTLMTKQGDCGALGVALTPRGPVILGLHTLGHNQTVGFPHVTQGVLEKLCESETPVVEGGGEPMLALNGEVVLVEPHHKSIFRYLPEGVANIYGSFSGFRPKPRSRVCATPLQDKMCDHFECELEFGRPNMSGWEPWHVNVKEMVCPNTNIDQSILDHCVESFSEDIIRQLTEAHGETWKGELVFLSDRAAVNGLPGVKFIDRINVNTSMGHPWCKSKKGFLISEPDERYPEGVNFDEHVWERVRKIEERYANGQRAFPVYTGHLKDEVLAIAKIQKKKIRMFTGAPIDASLVIRKKLLSFVRLLQKNKFIFEAAPGTAAQSIEWTHIYEYLTAHGSDRIVAGDYGKFDKHMIATFVLAAYRVIIRIHREAGFSEAEVRGIMCIGYDTAFPVVNVNGDLIEFFGTNPSGHPLTVVVNSIVNSLYMRYAFCLTNPKGNDCTEFTSFVNLMTYGDDNAMGVSQQAPWFNHTAIQSAMAVIGVEYTMADKESVSRPYIHIDDCSFLKRSWRYESDVQAYVCPLEVKSIHKSLTMWVPSDTIDKYAQMVSVISSANSEFFFHGRKTFEKHHKFFKEILEEHPYNLYVCEATLPNWENLCERFRQASEGI